MVYLAPRVRVCVVRLALLLAVMMIVSAGFVGSLAVASAASLSWSLEAPVPAPPASFSPP